MTNATLILAMRASPDWARLAGDHAAGQPIVPSRYLPAEDPRFPTHIPRLIERWNRFSGLSFFECRRRLRDVAAANLAAVAGVMTVRASAVPGLLAQTDHRPLLLFYHDDDDWFHPDMAGLVGQADFVIDQIDAAVFPFYRLASNMTTFTRDGAATRTALGRCAPFRFRYCTNNYGLTRRALRAGPARLVNHVDASDTAEALGFTDKYCDTIVSATNKTPCSASWLSELPDGREAFQTYVWNYITVLERVVASVPEEWIAKPLGETIAIFKASL